MEEGVGRGVGQRTSLVSEDGGPLALGIGGWEMEPRETGHMEPQGKDRGGVLLDVSLLDVSLASSTRSS